MKRQDLLVFWTHEYERRKKSLTKDMQIAASHSRQKSPTEDSCTLNPRWLPLGLLANAKGSPSICFSSCTSIREECYTYQSDWGLKGAVSLYNSVYLRVCVTWGDSEEEGSASFCFFFLFFFYISQSRSNFYANAMTQFGRKRRGEGMVGLRCFTL